MTKYIALLTDHELHYVLQSGAAFIIIQVPGHQSCSNLWLVTVFTVDLVIYTLGVVVFTPEQALNINKVSQNAVYY